MYYFRIKRVTCKTQELAYLIGALQGDGCFYKYKTEYRGRSQVRYTITLKVMDLEFVKKCRDIFYNVFGRYRSIYTLSSGAYGISYGVKTLMVDFKDLEIVFKDPPRPPSWIKENEKFFGAYLAGLIDADGSVCIKRPKYPQCSVKITSGHRQTDLEKSIKRILKCGVFIETKSEYSDFCGCDTLAFNLRFVISPKNMEFFKNHVLPWVVLLRKSEVIRKYIELRESKIILVEKARKESRTPLTRFRQTKTLQGVLSKLQAGA